MAKNEKKEVKRTVKTKASDMLLLAVLAYLLLLIEPIFKSIVYDNLYYLIPLGGYGWTFVHRLVCIAVWVFGAIGLIKMSEKNCAYAPFELKTEDNEKPSALQWALISALSAGLVLFFIFDNMDKLKHYIGLLGSASENISFVMNYIFLAVEGLVIAVIIAFGQKFGNIAFGKGKWIPYGGIVLGLCWVIMGIFSTFESWSTYFDWKFLVGMMVYGIIFGLLHIIMGSRLKYSAPFIIIVFMMM